jgi:hypothetical protein
MILGIPAFGLHEPIVFTSSISNTSLFAGVKTEYASTAFSSSRRFTDIRIEPLQSGAQLESKMAIFSVPAAKPTKGRRILKDLD